MGLGYLAQEPSIFRNLTVAENVMAILETLPISARERRRRLEYLLEELKISYLARQKAYTQFTVTVSPALAPLTLNAR